MKLVNAKWRDKALRLEALLSEVAALDDGDETFAWKHEGLFNRIRAELKDQPDTSARRIAQEGR